MTNHDTRLSADQQWKVEAHAFANLFVLLPYKSIGTSVDVYHSEPHKDFWGGGISEWVSKPATQIIIVNTYTGSFPTGTGSATKSESGHNTSHFESKLWAVGVSVTFWGNPPLDPELHSASPDAPLTVSSVSGQYIVTVAGGQVIRGQVNA
jgi:hypothetical protein